MRSVNIIFFFLLILAVFMFSTVSEAFNLQDIWKSYYSDSGLPSRVISTIIVDSGGLVWIGTTVGWFDQPGGGIAKFDGESWTIYNTENSDISEDEIAEITDDRDGLLWIAPLHGNLMSYDGNVWETYFEDITEIRDIVVDSTNRKWLGTGTQGLYTFDGAVLLSYTAENSGLLDNGMKELAVDVDNTVWIAYEGGYGVSHFDGAAWTHYTSVDGLADDEVNTIAIEENGTKWFGTNRGVTSFDGSEWRTFTTEDGLMNDTVVSSAIDSSGVKWFGMLGGVSSFDGARWWNYSEENSEIQHGTVIKKIAVDSNNMKWIVDGSAIVYRFDNSSAPFIVVTAPNGDEVWEMNTNYYITWKYLEVDTVRIEYSIDNGLTWRTLSSEFDASKQEIWWSHNTPSAETLIRITDTGNPAVCDTSDTVFSILEGPFIILDSPRGGEAMEAGTYRGLLWRASSAITQVRLEFSGDGGETWSTIATGVDAQKGFYAWQVPDIVSSDCLVRVTSESSTESSATSESVFSITPSRFSWTKVVDSIPVQCLTAVGEDIWYGVEDGLYRMNRYTGAIVKKYTMGYGLVGNDVRMMEVDRHGVLWVYAIFEQVVNHWGLSRFNGDSWTNYTIENGLIDRRIVDMIFDNENNLYVAGYRPGDNIRGFLQRFDGSNWESIIAGDKEGDRTISALAVDDDNNVWMGIHGFQDAYEHWKLYGGLKKFDGRNFQVWHGLDGVPRGDVRTMTCDHEGILWATAGDLYENNIWCFDKNTWTVYLPEDVGFEFNTHTDSTPIIFVDRHNVKWFGMKSGLIRFDGTVWSCYIPPEEWGEGSCITDLKADVDGVLLVGTNTGVYRFDDGVFTGIEHSESIPEDFRILSNYPNPFNPSTTIFFTLPSSGFTNLTIYNIMGQKVRELIAGTMRAGSHSITWDGTDYNGNDLAAGLYLSRLESGSMVLTGKMVLLK